MEIEPRYYLAICAGLVAFQAAMSFVAARAVSAGVRVPLGWRFFGRPTGLAAPAFAFARGPLWAAFAYAMLIAPMPIWGWPDVADWYLAMTGAVALFHISVHGVYLVFARRHADRAVEDDAFLRGARAAFAGLERPDGEDQ